jgi:4-carboxymuconolactone decarboxylase
MPRLPYYEVENATGKHAEFLDKLKPHLNIYRMLANSEPALKGFIRMGNALLYRCELDPVLRELAIIRVGRLSRAAYEVFQHERIGREAGVTEDKISALRDATPEAAAFNDNEKAVLRFADDVVRNVKASDKTLKAVQTFLSPAAVTHHTLTIGYYMMVCRFLETTGVEGEEGQAEWLKTAKL